MQNKGKAPAKKRAHYKKRDGVHFKKALLDFYTPLYFVRSHGQECFGPPIVNLLHQAAEPFARNVAPSAR